MKEIKLTRGAVALVDDEDFERLSKHKWSMVPGNRGTPYAAGAIKDENGKWRFTRMHRFLMQAKDPSMVVDHINGNGLDNRRENMRLISQRENCINQPKPRKSKSGFRGVVFRKDCANRYQAVIRIDGRVSSLGFYDTAEEAARVRDAKAREVQGELCGFLNFPEEACA